MYSVEKEIWINCRPQDAFDLHADHANRVTWHDHVTFSEMITPPPLAAGSRFQLEVIAARRTVPMEIEITAYDPYNYYSYRSMTSSTTSNSHQTFTEEDGGTRFHVRIEIEFHGWTRPLGWFILKFNLEKHFEEALRELKDKLENKRSS